MSDGAKWLKPADAFGNAGARRAPLFHLIICAGMTGFASQPHIQHALIIGPLKLLMGGYDALGNGIALEPFGDMS